MRLTESYENYQYTVNAVIVLILAVVLLIITPFHTLNVYRDLHTTERKCFTHRTKKPDLSRSYKAISYATELTVVSLTWALVFTAIEYNFNSNCSMALAVCEKIGFFTGRCALYIVYILRLHNIYGTSGFGWSTNILKVCGILIVLLSIALFLFTTLTIVNYPVYIDASASGYPYYCQIISDKPWVHYAGFGILFFDLICSILSIIAFTIPMNKIGRQMNENSPKTYADKVKKMKAIGKQYKVLVIIGSCATLLWIVLLLTQQLFLATFAINLDYFINTIVVCLMASYYPSDEYFDRLCGICVFVAGVKQGKTYHSRASIRTENEESVDTSVMLNDGRLTK